MEKIINEVTEKLNREIKEFFSGREGDVGTAERYFGNRIAEAVLELLRAYYEKCDRELLVDKVGRKQAGLVVERRRDKREILTQLERIFGLAKELHGFRYTQQFGKAQMEVKAALTYACLNLKKLAKKRWKTRPIPSLFQFIFNFFSEFSNIYAANPLSASA